MTFRVLPLALLLVAPYGCDSSKSDGDKSEKSAKADGDGAKAKADGDAKAGGGAKADDGDTLPTETETLALDEGESKIPATIDVPKGCETFNDDPTKIRIDHGKMGKLFGVQVAKGNEFNTDLDQIEKDMSENKYGNTNEILEKTDTLLRWTMQREGGEPNHKFQMLITLGEDTWVCKDGNYGGWTEEQSKRQIEACKTLEAKG
jgi:hypothetical protein